MNEGDDEFAEALAGMLFGIPVFIGSWIYCIATYGYLLGVGLGWLPSVIVAAITATIGALIIRFWRIAIWIAIGGGVLLFCLSHAPAN